MKFNITLRIKIIGNVFFCKQGLITRIFNYAVKEKSIARKKRFIDENYKLVAFLINA